MTVVFVIVRLPWYQLFAPAIAAALARGWRVECWHDYSQPADGLKGYQFPSMDKAPTLPEGSAVNRAYRSPEELAQWLRDERVDALVSIRTPRLLASLPPDTPIPVCVEMQHTTDTFVAQTPEQLFRCDVVAMYSEWWQQWGQAFYRDAGQIANLPEYTAAMSTRAVSVGLPELDAAEAIDPAEVRRRWNIPAQQPVVVLLPFPQGVGREGFWARKIYGEPSRVRQLANIIRHGRFEYLPSVWHDWNDRRVVTALRAFCDRNGAFLLVKSRMKTPIPDYLAAVADKCLYDEQLFPASILEVLSIAHMSVGHFTAAVLESIALGVPHVCVPFRADDYAVGGEADRRAFDRTFVRDEGHLFQFRGASMILEVPDLLARLATATLDDFAIDPDARDRYVRQFLTHRDGHGGARLTAAIEHAVSARHAASAPGVS